jgi:hypothetical protein
VTAHAAYVSNLLILLVDEQLCPLLFATWCVQFADRAPKPPHPHLHGPEIPAEDGPNTRGYLQASPTPGREGKKKVRQGEDAYSRPCQGTGR